MAIDITVQHRDGRIVKSTVWPATEVAFEDHFGLSWSEAWSSTNPPQKYLYFAAYHSHRDGDLTHLEFDEWLRTIAEVSLEPVAVDPSNPEA